MSTVSAAVIVVVETADHPRSGLRFLAADVVRALC